MSVSRKYKTVAINKAKPRAAALTTVFVSLSCNCILGRKDNRSHKGHNV